MGQSCIKGAIPALSIEREEVKIPSPGQGEDGDVSELGDAGGGPGKSSLFFLTARRPWNRIIRR